MAVAEELDFAVPILARGERGDGRGVDPGPPPRERSALARWLRIQAVNVRRHAAALRPFRSGEFGTGPESPSEAHRLAANKLLHANQRRVLAQGDRVRRVGNEAIRRPTSARLARFVAEKQRAIRVVKEAEKVWEFYGELFQQRRSDMAPRLLAADRIGLDCYQAAYTSLGKPRSVPSPPPFSYQETGLAPSTFRRGVRISGIGRRENPFPLVKLPHHRLVNPWTLGAIAHEVSHNLQADLSLWRRVPERLGARLQRDGFGPGVTRIWQRWHKETWADLCGLLLIGPAYVGSLMDVVAHSHRRIARFNPAGVHPTPFLRVPINLELVRRRGFRREAESYGRAWRSLYPKALSDSIPREFATTFPRAVRSVVDEIAFRPFAELGDKSLAQVIRFNAQNQAMVKEAARRLASGTDPGIVPERFLIGAARIALEQRLARPETIARHFYDSLGRR